MASREAVGETTKATSEAVPEHSDATSPDDASTSQGFAAADADQNEVASAPQLFESSAHGRILPGIDDDTGMAVEGEPAGQTGVQQMDVARDAQPGTYKV